MCILYVIGVVNFSKFDFAKCCSLVILGAGHDQASLED